jgi:hypothetical protein
MKFSPKIKNDLKNIPFSSQFVSGFFSGNKITAKNKITRISEEAQLRLSIFFLNFEAQNDWLHETIADRQQIFFTSVYFFPDYISCF